MFALFPLIVLAALSNALATEPPRPTNSSPIAISTDDAFVWVVNRDNNSVTLFKVANDVNLKISEVKVGKEPRTLALTPDGSKLFVTNMVSGTVSVVSGLRVIATIPVGTEPFGCALTPDGTRLYVANFGSDDVSLIDTNSLKVVKTITGVGPKPRGIAITAGNPAKVYVTNFLAQLRNDMRLVTEKEGRDDGKEGHVTVISAASNTVTSIVTLNPLAKTGFNSDGSTLDRITVPPAAAGSFITGAFPNLLQSIVIQGNRAYLPNTASSPNGPFKFNVNVQGFLSVFDTGTDTDSGQTINMNNGVQNEDPKVKLFITNPIAIAFDPTGTEGWVVSAATNRIIRVTLDANGMPTINPPPPPPAPTGPFPPDTIVRVEVGLNPQGIVLNSAATRAYVENFISRDLSVVDIGSVTPKQLARLQATDLPAPGSLDAVVHRGHELFNTSIGPAGVGASAPPAGRMSNAGWGSCYSCHPDGLHDGVTWMFPDGPRQSISMESTFAHPQPHPLVLNASGAPIAPDSDQRVLNWSAVRDEVQDFERNIRLVSGGQGLIDALIADVPDLVPKANAGRSADLDTIAAYIAFGIRAPISPLRNALAQQGDIQQGRALFTQANCQSCHGGPKWSLSRVDFTPPPLAPPNAFPEVIVAGQLVRFLEGVATFDPAAFNEVKAQAGTQTAIVTASGLFGFNVPSLLSVGAGAPYLHSGSAATLDEVLINVEHRRAGIYPVDTLADPATRAKLVQFLKSIDAKTQPFQ